MVWERVKELLREELSENVFNLWIAPIECIGVEQSVIKLCCPDRFFSAYITRNYFEIIQAKLTEVDHVQRKVVFSLPQAKLTEEKTQKEKAIQLRLPSVPAGSSSVKSLHPRYTFAEFMVGESNILAQSACRSITQADDSVGPCLYINSSTGLGKSHLTHAVAHQILAEAPMTRLHYLTAQQFSYEMVKYIRSNSMGGFKEKYHQHCDILLVEDVHSLAGKKKTQEELNELLDVLIKAGKRVVFTGNKPPRELKGVDGEFCSRMAAGLVTAIQPPDISTRTRIIRSKTQQHSLDLAEEHIDYLAQHIKGDVRQIESAIFNLRAKAQLSEGTVDLALIKQVVNAVVGAPSSLTPGLIREFICKQYNVCGADLQSRSRKKVLTFPRQVAMYLCRKHTEKSLADIGKEFNRDHSTVLHSIKVVTDMKNRHTSVSEQVDLLSKKLKTL